MKKPYIVFCGTHSTGKTTIVKAAIPLLQELYGDPVYHISEISRKLNAKLGVSINSDSTSGTQKLIESEYAREEAEHSDSCLIADRSVVDRFAYTLLSKAVLDDELVTWYRENVKEIASKYTHLFFVPLTPDLGLELDGVRSPDEDFRKRVNDLEADLIKTFKLNAHIITGSTEQRLVQIRKALTGV